jgi:hypothetical protein
MTLCVYGLVSPDANRIRVKGIAGETLRVVTAGVVAAVVGDIDRPPPATEANLRAFDAVVRRLADRVPALLPARFATCVESVDALVLAIAARERSLRQSLRLTRGRAQMTVRLVGAPVADGTTDRIRGVDADGARYLRARARAVAREGDVPALEPIRRAVQRWVRAERVETRGTIATLYHLVPRSTVERYRRAAGRAARAAGLTPVVTGPWPAYAFAASWTEPA